MTILVDGKQFFKFYYPVMHPRIESLFLSEEKKFCTLISSRLSSKHPKELYSEREKTIRFLRIRRGNLICTVSIGKTEIQELPGDDWR